MHKILLIGIFSMGLISCTKKDKAAQTSKADPLELRMRIPAFPKSMNYYTAHDVYVGLVMAMTNQSMVAADEDTYKELPGLAKSWKESPDHKTFTFTLDENAKFSDGTPVTAEDVKFTFDLIWNAKKCALCEPVRSFVGPTESVKVLEPLVIEIKMKNIHFQNLVNLGGVYILPKHFYGAEGKDFTNDFGKQILGSGPYILKELKGRSEIVLEKNPEFWGHKVDHATYKGYYNFKTIRLKYVDDDTVAFELFKKKELDFIYVIPKLYDQWDAKESYPWTDPNVVRFETPFNHPSQWGGVSINMRHSPLNDKKFRQALQLLVNREFVVEKVYKNKRKPVISPFMAGTPYSGIKEAIPFSPDKAVALLKEAGFTKVENGILYREKAGKKEFASFELMYSNETNKKWGTIFKEDAQKVGVDIQLKQIEWAAGLKLVDEFKFQGFAIGWSGNPVPSPEQLFDGKTANQNGTSNLSGLNNPELNQLISQGPTLFDEQRRYQVYQKIEKIIVDEQPYIFLFQERNHMIGYWKDRITPPEKPYLKYTGDDTRDSFIHRWKPAASENLRAQNN